MELKLKTVFVLACILFFSSVLFIGFSSKEFGTEGDGAKHYKKLLGDCCENHAPFINWVYSIFFIQDRGSFFLVNFFLFSMLFPYLLYKITENEFLPFFYFIGTNIPYFIFYEEIFPNALALIFWVFLLKVKNKRMEFLLLLISIFIHNSAFFLFVGTILIKHIPKNVHLITMPFFFTPKMFTTHWMEKINFFLLSISPLIFSIGLAQMILDTRKNIKNLLIFIFTIVFSFAVMRIFLFPAMLTLIVFSDLYKNLNVAQKGIVVLIIFIYYGYLIYSLFNAPCSISNRLLGFPIITELEAQNCGPVVAASQFVI